jgi:hypothetical protein
MSVPLPVGDASVGVHITNPAAAVAAEHLPAGRYRRDLADAARPAVNLSAEKMP